MKKQLKMNINQILEEICKKGSIYDEIIDNILGYGHEHKRELISEIAISYLESPEKIENIYKEGYFKYYFIQTISNQVKSNKSPFYKNTRVMINEIPTTFDVEDDLEETIREKKVIDSRIDQIENSYKEMKKSWFTGTIWDEYFYKDKSFRDIEKKYGIDHVLAWKEVKKVKEIIKSSIGI